MWRKNGRIYKAKQKRRKPIGILYFEIKIKNIDIMYILMIFRIRKVCFCRSVSLVFKNENALKTWLKQIVNIDLFYYCSQIIWNEKKNEWRTSSFRTEALGGKSEYVVHVVNSWAMLYMILLLRNKMIYFYTVVGKEKYSDFRYW